MTDNFAAKPGLCAVIGQTFSKVWGRTSISGLSHAYEPPLRPWRAIWVLFFVVGLVFTVIDVTRVVQNYLEYPHTTQMDVVYDRSAYFPAVTVCNENRIDCENLMNASVHDPDNTKLVKLLHLSNCLEGNGLVCPYQWQISAGVATREWIDTVKPYCLHCKFCARIALYLQSQDGRYASDLASLAFVMGCNSTCIQPASSKGSTSSDGSQKNNVDSSSNDQEKGNTETTIDNSGNEEGKNSGGTANDEPITGEDKGTGESASDSSGNGEEKEAGGASTDASTGEGKGTATTANTESVDGGEKSSDGTTNDNSGTGEEKGTGESADDTSGGGEEKGTGETVNDNPDTVEEKGTSESADDASGGAEEKGTDETVNDNSGAGRSEDNSSDNGEAKGADGSADDDSGSGKATDSAGSAALTTESEDVTGNGQVGATEDIDGDSSPPSTTQSQKASDGEVSSAASPEESSGKNAPAPEQEPSPGKARPAPPQNRPKRATKSFKGRKNRKKFNPEDFEDSQIFNERMDLLMNFMKLDTELRLQIGVSFDDLIKDCTYLGKKCGYKQLFWKVSSPEYGTCYTFNTNITEFEDPLAGQRTTGLTGEQYSLNFMLNLKHYAYPPTLTPSKGARILVHPPNQVPDMGDNAVSLYPGASTSLAIEQLIIRRLPNPYKAGCINSWSEAEYVPEPADVEAEGEETKETYTVSRCKKMCIQDMFVQHCNCFHPLYPETDTFKRREGARTSEKKKPCLMSLKAPDTICTAQVLTKFDQGILRCQCPPACLERAYNVYQSMNKWPRETFMEELMAQMNISADHVTAEDTMRVQSNVVQAKVFFKTLNTQELVQTPQFSTQSLFSSLGGALSLYLGISIVMVAEIIEFLFLLFWNIGLYATGRYRPSVAPEPVEMGDVSQVIIRRPDGSQVSFMGSLSGYPLLAKPSYNPPAVVTG